MPTKSERHYSSSAEATRPNISPEKEAEYCSLPVHQVRELRKRLEESNSGSNKQKALNDCVRLLSITATEAATIIGMTPSVLTRILRYYGGDGFYFQHKGRWRIWTAYVRNAQEENPQKIKRVMR